MTTYSYIGRCKCGAIVAATIDEPARKRQVAQDVAEMIRDGLAVERVDSDVVRVRFSRCTCEEVAESLPMFPES